MIDIILMEIENEGNLGAIARVMANFGFGNLILIDPRCSPDSIETIKRAKHAKDVLTNIKVTGKEVLSGYDTVIATTAKLGTDYNIPRSPITPKELREQLLEIDVQKTNIGILIGREGDGLTNEEIKQADFLLTIPASVKYPTLNISHGVGIICYELSKPNTENSILNPGFCSHAGHIVPAQKKDKDIFIKMLEEKLDKIDFDTPEKRETQRLVWKKLIGKSFLTKREFQALMGFLRKI